MSKFLYPIFFLSGAAALIFESLWFRQCGLAFGNSVIASSIVLASFMCGLAVGNGLIAYFGSRLTSPIRVFAFLEFIIALLGFSLVILLPYASLFSSALFRTFFDSPIILNIFRALFAFILLSIPATAMGATLPLLVKALYRSGTAFGNTLGLLYGWNTLGAVCGVILCETMLVGLFGVRGSALFAAACNCSAASLALFIFHRTRIEQPTAPALFSMRAENLATGATFMLLLAGFFSGFALLALEVVWFRFVVLFFMAKSWNFAVMLAVVLSGISLGGFFAAFLFKYSNIIRNYLVSITVLSGILVIITYTYFSIILNMVLHDVRILLVIASLFLMFPTSFISGMLFTMIGNELFERTRAAIESTGFLTLFNTIGAMAGSAVGGFVLIPFLGIENSFFLISLLYGGIALLLLLHEKIHPQATIDYT